MEKQDFLKALEIISECHSTEMVINKPTDSFVGDLGTTKFTIGIKNCCAGVVNRLKKADYMLSMNEGLLTVDKI